MNPEVNEVERLRAELEILLDEHQRLSWRVAEMKRLTDLPALRASVRLTAIVVLVLAFPAVCAGFMAVALALFRY